MIDKVKETIMGTSSSKPSFFGNDFELKPDDVYIENSADEDILLDLASKGVVANLSNFIDTHPAISLEAKNKNGENFLLLAARSGNLATFKYALRKAIEYGVSIDQPNKEGKNSAQLAAENGFQEIAEYLLNEDYQPAVSFGYKK